MGIGIKVFFVEEGGKLRRISLKRFEGLIDGDKKAKPLPEYAGQRVRYAFVMFNNENRKPSLIRHVDYSVFCFDDEGRMRRDEWDKQTRLSVELLCNEDYKMLTGVSLVNATHVFAKRQLDHEFKWKPSAEMERKIINAVFIRKEIKKKRHLRLVKPPNKTKKSI